MGREQAIDSLHVERVDDEHMRCAKASFSGDVVDPAREYP